MKRKNPYILIAIAWALISALCAVSSVVLFVDDRLAIGLVMVCLACGFAFVTGILSEKARAIIEFNAQVRFLEQAHEALSDFVAELEKAEENRPFKEFDKPNDLPFEEVRNKEK